MARDKAANQFEKSMLAPQVRYTVPHGARQIVLVRHGSAVAQDGSTLSIGGLLASDPGLLPVGFAQANAVAERLRGESISRIFVTPLQRTQQTAAPLAKFLGIDPIVVDELREVHLGDFEHDLQARAAADDPLLRRMYTDETWDFIPNAESMAQFAVRVRAGVVKAAGDLESGSSAVAFVHGGTIGEICRQATSSRPFAFFAPDNTSITRLIVLGDGRWSLRSYNDTSHL